MKRLIIITILALAGLSSALAQTENDTKQPADTAPATTAPATTAPATTAPATTAPATTAPATTAPATTAPATKAPATTAPATKAPSKQAPSKPESSYDYEPIRKGDQFIRVGVGLGKSLFNLAPSGIVTKTNLNLGGTAAIGYSRFITSKIALGGELNFSFNSTLGSNMYFYLPVVFKTTYEMVFDRIHVPLSLGTGFAFQTYNNATYFGFLVKPEVGAYFQYKPDWSIGTSVAWNVLPEWYSDKSLNRTGNILDIVLGVRYHF